MKKQNEKNNETKNEANLETKKEADLVQELTNDLQRTRADFENYRKQIEIQKEQERKMAKYATVMKVLPLIDDFERAIENYKELEPLDKSLEKTLKELGLERISSDEGVPFDPDYHEAMMVEGDGDNEVIAETMRAGYLYEGEIIRPAMVKVKRQDNNKAVE